MLLTKEIEIRLNNDIKYYQNLGYDCKYGDFIKIDINHLKFGSRYLVNVKCDYCGLELDVEYKRYKKFEKFACSKKCAAIRTREILMDKYGVDNLSKVPDIKKKIQNTNLEKYGSKNYLSSKDARYKIENTMMDKYGVSNYTKTDDYIKKTKKTNVNKYGVEWVMQNDEIKNKVKKTNLERYGFEQASKSNFIKNKIIDTNQKIYGFNSGMMSKDVQNKSKDTLLKNYGVDSPLRSEIVKDSVKKTNLERYGVEYIMQSQIMREKSGITNMIKLGSTFSHQSESFRKSNFGISNNENYLSYIGKSVSLFKCDIGKDHDFEIHTDNYFRRKEQNLSLCTICYPIDMHISIKEENLYFFISSIYNGQILKTYRDQFEIDIYLSDLNLGFEFNGLYWHSNKFKDKYFHYNKTKYFKEKGIRIIHIWEDDWDYKRDIIKSKISNLLKNNNQKIYARKCEIKEVKSNEARIFLDGNHIQGFVKSNLKLGLYYKDQLVSLMSFDHFEGRKKMSDNEWNLNRFCTILNTNVIGGGSKLLKYFIDNYNPSRIISYADKDNSVGNLYEILGFNKVYESKPDYKYIINNKRIHKSRYKKSESKLDFLKVYDCGKIKYELLN